MRPSRLLVTCLTLLHLSVSALLIAAGTGMSLGTFESGSPPSRWAELMNGAGTVLLYPVFIPAGALIGQPTGPVAWLLLVLNSLVWALAALLLLRLLYTRKARRTRTA